MNAIDLGPLVAAIEANREAIALATCGRAPWPDVVDQAWADVVARCRERHEGGRG